MNSVDLIGNICNDWEYQTTENGKIYAKNTIAVRKNKDASIFLPIRIWGGTVEIVEKYTKKGDKIGVSGKLDVYSYEKDNQKQYYTYINVNEVHLIERRS